MNYDVIKNYVINHNIIKDYIIFYLMIFFFYNSLLNIHLSSFLFYYKGVCKRMGWVGIKARPETRYNAVVERVLSIFSTIATFQKFQKFS